MQAPVVGVTLRPQASNGHPSMMVRNRSYFDALEDAGGVVMPLPITTNSDHLRALYDRCDSLCMPGGPDVHPRLYGEAPRADCALDVVEELDDVEMQLVRWALADGKPLLAICRGMQLMNVALGGTLYQDLVTQHPAALRHQHQVTHLDVMHQMTIEDGTRLAALAGAVKVEVNSRHHQAVRDAAPSLQVSAVSPDGVVEAVEDPARGFLLGVQCHPEDLYFSHDWSQRLFKEFISHSSGG